MELLDLYVAEQIPKLKTVQTKHLEGMFENYSPDEIVLGSGMSSDEIIESFRLSLITESLTEEYSKTFRIGAREHNSPWLHRYVSEFWEPDEMGHADPFKNILVDFGLDQKLLDLDINNARNQTDYFLHHSSGSHPVSLTTYGMIQECITDYWYELQRGFFPDKSNTSKVLSLVKGREALHTVQFRDLTAIQIEHDPGLIQEVIFAIVNFQMPANHIPLITEIESKTQEWIPRMNGDITELITKIIGNIHTALNDKAMLGKIILQYASQSDKKFFDLIPQSTLIYCIGKIKGGYGLVGELVLEQLGLRGNDYESNTSTLDNVRYRLKRPLKRWVQVRLENEGFLHQKVSA